MKIVTLAAAAERLGWNYSFETKLVAAGPIDAGVLHGDLIVIGTGDPNIDDWDGAATRLFGRWAADLKSKGITKISGRIVGDDNLLGDQLLGAGWAWDDLASSFATSAGALQFNENTSRLTVMPASSAGEPAVVSLAPGGTGLTIRNTVQTAASSSVAAVESRRGAGSTVLELRGFIPVGAAPVVRNVSVYNPTLYFVTALRDALIANGIDVAGAPADIDEIEEIAGVPPAPDGAPMVSYMSPPLSMLAQTMMKNSQNLFAESLFNVIGARDAVRAVLQQWGIGASDVVVTDGSGLSRYNLTTPEALVEVLTHVYRDDRSRDPFTATLPIAGQDGTLAQRMKGTAADGNARAKSGTMSNVRALAGYVRTADGEPLVFAIVANNFGTAGDLVEDTTDALVVRLAEFRR
jgi:D-alanyl-D-alanine carboxypeptidase/D-alanyl-D-alanine-endopeptidase (penicillin-binding protein 4)